MSFDAFSDVNYLAVLVAALAYFALGAIWYIPPVMGTTWQKAGGIEVPEGQGPNPILFVGTLRRLLRGRTGDGAARRRDGHRHRG